MSRSWFVHHSDALMAFRSPKWNAVPGEKKRLDVEFGDDGEFWLVSCFGPSNEGPWVVSRLPRVVELISE